MMRRRGMWWVAIATAACVAVAVCAAVLIIYNPQYLGMAPGSVSQHQWLALLLAVTVVSVVPVASLGGFSRRLGLGGYSAPGADDVQEIAKAARHSEPWLNVSRMQSYLRDHHGRLWPFKLRLLLVVGEPEQVEAVAPGLVAQRWLEGRNHVLIYGGSPRATLCEALLASLRELRRRRPLDAVVWALNNEQSDDADVMRAAGTHLRHLAAALRWRLPLHLWEVRDCSWSQQGRETQSIGCQFSSRAGLDSVQTQLDQLVEPLRVQGWQQMCVNNCHDFMLRLSHELDMDIAARWRRVLTPLLRAFRRGTPLRGLWFSLPLHRPQAGLLEHWPMDPAWDGILHARSALPQWQGWHPRRLVWLGLLVVIGVWSTGLLVSFANNRALLADARSTLVAANQAEQGAQALVALSGLVDHMSLLEQREQEGEPWSMRFGLSRNRALLDALWPHYLAANTKLIRDPAVTLLQRRLAEWVALAPNSRGRLQRAHQAHDHLKAYLMLAQPEKVDADFLVQTLEQLEPEREDVPLAVWDRQAPKLWRFYAEQLARHPQLAIEPDRKLIAQVRQVLLDQLGQRTGEAALYQNLLRDAGKRYLEWDLGQMVGETDALSLFDTRATVPGVFTRQAWEGHVRDAIETIAQARHEAIDWVLSDRPDGVAADVDPQALRQRLTARYFADYGNAWLTFLNSVQWQRPHTLNDVVEQLALMSDTRQSPLVALFDTLAYQGNAGAPQQGSSESWVKSAQQFIASDPGAAVDDRPAGPLNDTFGSFLAVLGKHPAGTDQPNLSAFLSRVTRLRLTLQRASDAADPQAMTQALAQAVFQGKVNDLADTQGYGDLLAATLGAQWRGLGQALFVQPLELAWQKLLQPSAGGLNANWQRTIVERWRSAFTGRFPFAPSDSDASLPMLGQMIRSDSGRIEQFLQQQLRGVLRKEGNRWVADSVQAQGLHFDPQFLAAINQLSELADVLYSDGGMGMNFELRATAVQDLVQTTFVLDGVKHHYFNQKESWQRFTWPGRGDYPGTRLSWTSIRTGERLYGDFPGVWGLIRLLEQAEATVLDDSDSRYRLVVTAPDGIGLTWYLRTEMSAGPLALLKLRGFDLPQRIFITQGEQG